MKYILEFKDITMKFPGVKALDQMSFQAKSGEVLAFLGENGAGKSTLLKILNGDYQATSGQLFLEGEEKNFTCPNDAIQNGISIIYQERQIVEYLTVAENVFMGKYPLKRSGLIDYKRMNEEAQAIIDEFKLPIKATDQVKDLSIAHQQMVEIMKAYNRNLKVIAFDEPTASLSDSEIETLFHIIEKLKKRNVIIMYVSHRMKEIFQISDEVVVFKDGKFITKVTTNETNEDELVRHMVGRELGDIFNQLDKNKPITEEILKVNNLTNEYVKNVSFELRKGEVLGLAGLVGAGRTELVRAIFGADPIISGEIFLDGEKVSIKEPAHAIKKGIGLCPEDRKTQGIVPILSVKDNISMVVLDNMMNKGFIDFEEEKKLARQSIENLKIKTASMHKKIVELSGGNQQKAILARWLAANPKVLILDEPTKGIDVGAKAEFYKLIYECAKKGIGVVVISSELPEVIGLCDRILVMKNGEISGEVIRDEATEELILSYAMLGKKAI
ncbi:MAG: sugar ABC transporter ATP-binding protein [Marinisporobacter sp.]|nr:sugar ABC transporter ATP-binding protein [Marinisporobacter sp.]